MATKHSSGLSKRASARRPKMEAEEKIYHDLKKAPPVITAEVSRELEQFFVNVEGGWPRRVALAVCCMSGGEITTKVERDREAAVLFAESMKWIGDYVKRLREVTDILHTAEVRLMIALCARDDMDSVLAEAKRSAS